MTSDFTVFFFSLTTCFNGNTEAKEELVDGETIWELRKRVFMSVLKLNKKRSALHFFMTHV